MTYFLLLRHKVAILCRSDHNFVGTVNNTFVGHCVARMLYCFVKHVVAVQLRNGWQYGKQAGEYRSVVVEFTHIEDRLNAHLQ